MFPIYLKEDDEKLNVNDDIYYVIGKDGIYLRKNLDITDSLIKVYNIPFLGKIEEYTKLKIEKIKMVDFKNVVNFLRKVMTEYSSEGILILYYNYKTKKYVINCPDQIVQGAHVEYGNISASYEFGESYVFVGTIHSHPGRSAWHSGGDTRDEEKWDGLHLTIGGLSDKSVSISCSIMNNGDRKFVDPSEYIENLNDYKIEVKYKPIAKNDGKLNENEIEKLKEDTPKQFLGVFDELINHPYLQAIRKEFVHTQDKPEYSIPFDHNKKLVEQWFTKVSKYVAPKRDESEYKFGYDHWKKNQTEIEKWFSKKSEPFENSFGDNVFKGEFGNLIFKPKDEKDIIETGGLCICDYCEHKDQKVTLLMDEFEDFLDEIYFKEEDDDEDLKGYIFKD